MEERANTEAVIDLDALRRNIMLSRDLAAGRDVIGVVKADAYGHGAVPVAQTLVAAGCKRLAVVNVDEATVLREAGIDSPDILVLSGLRSTEEAREAADKRLTPVLHNDETRLFAAEAGRRAGAPIQVEVEVDTGMTRMGIDAARAAEFLVEVAATPALDLSGIFTHFSRADETDLAPCLLQLQVFRRVLEGARKNGVSAPNIHVANSAGLLAGKPIFDALPEATAVRPGLMLYGVQPAPHFDAPLAAVMCLQSQVVRLQDVVPGQPVGYGGLYRARQNSRIATVPVGYADGIPCSTYGQGSVWIRGKRRPIVGRVSMDYIGVDVGEENDDAPVEQGDRAVIFGNAASDPDGISVEEAAAWAGTIAYEPLVRVGQRVPRRVVGKA